MSREDWEVFDIIRQERKERKAKRRNRVAELFMQGGLPGWIRRTDTHYQYRLKHGFLDWWPGTCKFRYRNRTHHGDMNKVILFVEDTKRAEASGEN